MHELEQAWPDPDRRDDALERLLARVELEPIALAPAERRVLSVLSHGLTEREAADVTGWSYDSVHRHAWHARRLLGAKNVTHAVAIALRRRLIA